MKTITMEKNYRVSIPTEVHAIYIVKADSPDEAKKIAQADYMNTKYIHDMKSIPTHYYETSNNDEDAIYVEEEEDDYTETNAKRLHKLPNEL